MREAIERVISELELMKKTCNPNASVHATMQDAYFDAGLSNAYGFAIEKLKSVLVQHGYLPFEPTKQELEEEVQR